MLAQNYGYQVSSGPAVDVPATAKAVERPKKSVKPAFLYGFLPALCCLVFAIGAGAAGLLSGLWVAVAAVAPFVFGGIGTVLMPGKGSQGEQAIRVLVTTCPWQVWPCRVEELPGKASGAGVAPRRVLLLAPDGSIAGAFAGDMPDSVSHAMTDGTGLLWVCGDLRFFIALAAPGGAPVWLATSESERKRRSAVPADPGTVADLAREAGSATVWERL